MILQYVLLCCSASCCVCGYVFVSIVFLWKNRVMTFFHCTSMKAHFMRFVWLSLIMVSISASDIKVGRNHQHIGPQGRVTLTCSLCSGCWLVVCFKGLVILA